MICQVDIAELNLSVRDFNAVKRFGINSTEELIERLPDFCKEHRRTGAKVTEALHKLGLLPFHLGEWVEPERCAEELAPEEFREAAFIIMGFPTESRDDRKVVLIIKIDGDQLYFIDGKSDLMHHTIGDRTCWHIAEERGQAPDQTELEQIGVPEFYRKQLAEHGITSLAALLGCGMLTTLCRAMPSAVGSVFQHSRDAGLIPFAPGDVPEDTDPIGDELSYSDLLHMTGKMIVYAGNEYDAPFIALITRAADGIIWLWGDLKHPYSVTEKEFMEDCKAFRITNNIPQSGTNMKEETYHGNTEDSGNNHAGTDTGAASDAAECAAPCIAADTCPDATDRSSGICSAEPADLCPAGALGGTCQRGLRADVHGDADSNLCTDADCAASSAESDAADSGSTADADAVPGTDAGADSPADVHRGAARACGASAGGIGQARGAGGAADGVRRAVRGSDPGGQAGRLCGAAAGDGRTDLMPEVESGCCPKASGMPAMEQKAGVADHAKYAPSHAAIWGTCTASPEAEKGIPDKGSPYAAEGTLAHAIAELKVLKKFTPMSLTQYKNKLGKLKADPLYQPEMDGYTDAYIDEITKVCHAFPSKPYVVAEKRLDMNHIVPGCFGTADCVVICGDALHIFDFKYGKGVAVSADHNPQMRLYALGAVREYALLFGEPKTVTTHIVQPRIDNFDSEELRLLELTGWGDDLRRKMENALLYGTEFVPGAHCRFCKAKSLCRARAESLLTLEEPMERMSGGLGDKRPAAQKRRELETELCAAPSPARSPKSNLQGEVLTDAEIGDILLRAQTLENWVKGLEEYAQSKLLSGGEIPGWKLVEGRSVRTITDTDKAFGVLTESGYDADLLYERKPLGLTALEKLCGKKKLTELIGEFIQKPAGKPTLAPVSDKRKAFSKKKLEEMFKEDN